MKKIPAWKLLVDNGHFESREDAERWILAGRVYFDLNRIDKAGQLIPSDAVILVKGSDRKYVSRGGLKLEHALSAFAVPTAGQVALDCGASTGGFTDCLLQHGVSRVYAVDAGYGQLSGKLRADPRVVTMERVNLGDRRLAGLSPTPAIVTLDLSYLSLRKALPLAVGILSGAGSIVALVKPLFEVDDANIRRVGLIPSRAVYVSVLKGLAGFCASNGLQVKGITRSPILGSRGTEEYFFYLAADADRPPTSQREYELDRQIEAAVGAGIE